MRRLRIEHITEYRYSLAVSLSTHRLLLRPRDSYHVRVAAASLEIFPAHRIRYRRDPLDNTVALVDFLEATRDLRIVSNLIVEHHEDSPLDFVVVDFAVHYPFDYLTDELADLDPFRLPLWPEESDVLREWLADTLPATKGLQTYVLLDLLNQAIHAF